MKLRTPDGRWQAEQVSLSATPDPRVIREPGRQSAGDGISWRVTEHGFYAGSYGTLDEVREMMGDAGKDLRQDDEQAG